MWLAWLGLLCLLLTMFLLLVWHPHFLPVTLALVLFVGLGVLLTCGSLWRMIRGPQRARAACCLLLGTAPLWFMTGHFLYGLQIASGRQVPLNLPLKVLVPLGESVMDLEARFRYPQRTVGEKVVMISMPTSDAAEQVAAMDQHIREMEKRLGREINGRVHWVRGQLMGLQGKAILGMCMGSRPGEEAARGRELADVDRHEVAHCVSNRFFTPWSEPPALLIEGWAQANSGSDSTQLAEDAWNSRALGDWLPLRELTGPDWVGRHDGPVYRQGAPLVNHLLDKLGPTTFLELYTTCHRRTFADDCPRMLGVSLDELDAQYWADIERLATQNGSPPRRRLAQLKLGPDVDPAVWQALLERYVPAAERLRKPYEHVRLTVQYQYESVNRQGQATTASSRWTSLRSGDFRRLMIESPEGSRAYLAHPRQSLWAGRDSDQAAWRVSRRQDWGPEKAFAWVRRELENIEFYQGIAAILGASQFQKEFNLSRMTLVNCERYTKDGREYWSLCLQQDAPRGGAPWRTAKFVFAADASFALQTMEYALFDDGDGGGTVRGELGYDLYEGTPVLRSYHSATSRPDGSRTTIRADIVDRQFGPIPEDEFTAQKLLNGPVEYRTSPAPVPGNETPKRWEWCYVAYAFGAFSLVAGLILLPRTSAGRHSDGRSPAFPKSRASQFSVLTAVPAPRRRFDRTRFDSAPGRCAGRSSGAGRGRRSRGKPGPGPRNSAWRARCPWRWP